MKAVQVFFTLLFLSTGYLTQAQCNEWETLLGYKDVFVRDVVRDRFGNLYIVGNFSSTNFKIGTTLIPLYGTYSAFILKFDRELTLQWAKSVGSVSQEFAQRIVVDKDDNIVIAGYFIVPL